MRALLLGLVLLTVIGLAQQFQARLTLVHVVALPEETDVNLAAYLKKVETEADQILTGYRKQTEDAGVAVETTYLAHGLPASRILDAAQYRPVDT